MELSSGGRPIMYRYIFAINADLELILAKSLDSKTFLNQIIK